MFRILIVEDDTELRQLFQRVLVKNGYSVKGVPMDVKLWMPWSRNMWI